MSMLAIWICELSGLVQDSCGTKAALSYFYCLWFRLGIIGQLFKRGVILSLLFSYDLTFALGGGRLSPFTWPDAFSSRAIESGFKRPLACESGILSPARRPS